MATARQIAAARRNLRKTLARWMPMSPRQRARAQPQGRTRRRPGSTGKGLYYRIAVRPKSDFVSFRTQDVGRPGHIQRVAGRGASGSWGTVTWLIGKEDAHLERGRLVAETCPSDPNPLRPRSGRASGTSRRPRRPRGEEGGKRIRNPVCSGKPGFGLGPTWFRSSSGQQPGDGADVDDAVLDEVGRPLLQDGFMPARIAQA